MKVRRIFSVYDRFFVTLCPVSVSALAGLFLCLKVIPKQSFVYYYFSFYYT